MLLPRIIELLIPQLPQPKRDPLARIMRVNNLVDIPPRRRDERVRETVLIFLRPLRDLFGVTDVAAEDDFDRALRAHHRDFRSEEHTSELQSLMRISYAVFCLKKKKTI